MAKKAAVSFQIFGDFVVSGLLGRMADLKSVKMLGESDFPILQRLLGCPREQHILLQLQRCRTSIDPKRFTTHRVLKSVPIPLTLLAIGGAQHIRALSSLCKGITQLQLGLCQQGKGGPELCQIIGHTCQSFFQPNSNERSNSTGALLYHLARNFSHRNQLLFLFRNH